MKRRRLIKQVTTGSAAALWLSGSQATPAAGGTKNDPDYTINKADDYQWSHGGHDEPCNSAENGVGFNLGFVSINSNAGGTGCNGKDQWEHRMVLYGAGTGARDPDHENYDATSAAYVSHHECKAKVSSEDADCGEYTINVNQAIGVGIPTYDFNDMLDEYHYGEDKSTPDSYSESKDRSDTWADDYNEIDRSKFSHWDSVTAFAALAIGTAGLASSYVAWPIIGVSMAGATFLETLTDDNSERSVAEDLDNGDGFRTYMEPERNVSGWGAGGHYHDFEATVPADGSMEIDVWHDIGFQDEDACGHSLDSMIDSDYSYTIHIPANAADESDPNTPYVEFGR